MEKVQRNLIVLNKILIMVNKDASFKSKTLSKKDVQYIIQILKNELRFSTNDLNIFISLSALMSAFLIYTLSNFTIINLAEREIFQIVLGTWVPLFAEGFCIFF